MADGEIILGIRDNTGEMGRVEVHTGAVTAISLPDLLVEFGALRDSIEDLVIGVMASESLKAFETKLSSARPSDKQAQKGIKWTVGYADTQQFFDPGVNAIPNAGFNKIFTFTIPTANLDLLVSGAEELVLTTGPGAAFKAAFEATARSPYGGTTTVMYVKYSD